MFGKVTLSWEKNKAVSFLQLGMYAPHPFMLIQLGHARPAWGNLTYGAVLRKHLMNLVSQQVKRVNITVKMPDSPFHLLCITRFIFQEKSSRANVHLCTWPVCKIKCSTKLCSWTETLIVTGITASTPPYLEWQIALNSKPIMVSETESEVQETSS